MQLLLPLVAFLLVDTPSRTTPPAPFTAERFRAHVAYLASDELEGREVGSPGAAKALAYLRSRLQEAGARPVGASSSWFQEFPFATAVVPRASCRLEAIGGRSLTLLKDFMPAGDSPDAEVQGELVFVGHGAHLPKAGRNDFAHVDLKGKIALALDGQAPALTQAGRGIDLFHQWDECERRGATGLVIIAPRGRSSFTQPLGLRGDRPHWRIPCVLVRAEAMARFIAPSGKAVDVVGELEAAAAKADLTKAVALPKSVFVRVALDRKVIPGRNLVAVVPGRGDLAREAIIVSSHHDHLGIDPDRIKAGQDGIYNGADDNASGCAAMLLVAEALHADREHLPGSYRTILFASFDAEEKGLVGSRYYVQQPLWPLERTAADLNFDMVGRLHGAKLVALDSQSNLFLTDRIQKLAPACGLRVETRLSGARPSDNANFLDRSIPAVQFNSGMHADYHQVTDEVSKIDADGGARISWLAYRVLRAAMETPGRLAYRRPPPAFDVQSIIRFVLKLGIVPEQNAQAGKYALIRYVVPGSLASRYGLKSGDEITGLNGKHFESIIDAAVAFASLRFDQPLSLSLLRQGKTVDITLPAELFKDFAGPTSRSLGKDEFEVEFHFKPGSRAKSVALAGSFNNWDVKAQPMSGPEKDGTYSTKLVLKAGFYEYKYVLDGKTWRADPTNFRTNGPEGNSVLILELKP